jgi:hypothetical protein
MAIIMQSNYTPTIPKKQHTFLYFSTVFYIQIGAKRPPSLPGKWALTNYLKEFRQTRGNISPAPISAARKSQSDLIKKRVQLLYRFPIG